MVRHALEDTRGVPPCKTAGKLILRKKNENEEKEHDESPKTSFAVLGPTPFPGARRFRQLREEPRNSTLRPPGWQFPPKGTHQTGRALSLHG